MKKFLGMMVAVLVAAVFVWGTPVRVFAEPSGSAYWRKSDNGRSYHDNAFTVTVSPAAKAWYEYDYGATYTSLIVNPGATITFAPTEDYNDYIDSGSSSGPLSIQINSGEASDALFKELRGTAMSRLENYFEEYLSSGMAFGIVSFFNPTGLEFSKGKIDLTEPVSYTFTEPGDYLVSFSWYNQQATFYCIIWVDENVSISSSASQTSASTAASSASASASTTATPAAVTTVSLGGTVFKSTEGLVPQIPPAPVVDQDLYYTVRPGETLWGIAFNYYGTMSDATVNKIFAANAEYFKSTKNVLEAGAVLALPAKGLQAPVTQSGLANAGGVYLVKSGDTLSDLAEMFYGDKTQWRKIYEANKDRVKLVGTSPMIYECQWLIIPK